MLGVTGSVAFALPMGAGIVLVNLAVFLLFSIFAKFSASAR
jgi:hypothetical protein